ncbi:hypothetical protein ABIA18_002739 [Sinorhizobium fredii]
MDLNIMHGKWQVCGSAEIADCIGEAPDEGFTRTANMLRIAIHGQSGALTHEGVHLGGTITLHHDEIFDLFLAALRTRDCDPEFKTMAKALVRALKRYPRR